MKIYLAGGFYADNWHKKVTTGIKDVFPNAVIYNPKDKERNEENEIITKAFSDPKVYTTWDLMAIDNSEYVFAYIDKGNPAIGTTAEIGYAVGKGKKIVLVTDPVEEGEEAEKRYHKDRYFDFLRNMPNVVSFKSLDDGILYINNIISFEDDEFGKNRTQIIGY